MEEAGDDMVERGRGFGGDKEVVHGDDDDRRFRDTVDTLFGRHDDLMEDGFGVHVAYGGEVVVVVVLLEWRLVILRS